MVKFKRGNLDAYPWQGMSVPILITGEYENFLIGNVLPHCSLKGYGLSIPYPITIDKHNISIGEMTVIGGQLNEKECS